MLRKRIYDEDALVSAARQRLACDPLKGELVWIASRYRKGKLAGSIKRTGYREIQFGEFGCMHYHRLVWMHVNGKIPNGLSIDHIDGDKLNNSISNLRLATPSQQAQNKNTSQRNKTGFKGVAYTPTYAGKKKYIAFIYLNGKNRNLGRFHTPEEGAAAYELAARNNYGEFASIRPAPKPAERLAGWKCQIGKHEGAKI